MEAFCFWIFQGKKIHMRTALGSLSRVNIILTNFIPRAWHNNRISNVMISNTNGYIPRASSHAVRRGYKFS